MARWGDGGSKILDTPLMLPQNRATDINLRSSPQCPQKNMFPPKRQQKTQQIWRCYTRGDGCNSPMMHFTTFILGPDQVGENKRETCW